MTKKKYRYCDLTIILDAVSEYFRFDKYRILMPTNKHDVVYKRQLFHYLAIKLNPKKFGLPYHDRFNYRKIGEHMSDITDNSFTHATVIHSYNVINDRKKIYAYVRGDLRNILYKIENKLLFENEKNLKE